MLELHGITAGYGAFTALWDVGLTVTAGEAVAVVGPNGAGKTTLLRAISGLIVPNALSFAVGKRAASASSTRAAAARDHHGDVSVYRVDAHTRAVVDQKQTVPFPFEDNVVGMSALDAKAVILLYNKMLSGALEVLPPLDDFHAENFIIQQRDFDRSHTEPDTTYYEIYIPQRVPKKAGRRLCGYFRNYRIETATWAIAVEPLNC